MVPSSEILKKKKLKDCIPYYNYTEEGSVINKHKYNLIQDHLNIVKLRCEEGWVPLTFAMFEFHQV
jgi:hypothetical protein